MGFFGQLKLLLWKNGLGIIRRPAWSVTLIVWPIVIFIIIAVTRHQFPPVLRQTCYVGPRNLPSTGFFPFLETLMCNVDSDCHNTSRLTPSKQPPRAKRSTQSSEESPLARLIQAKELMQYATSNNDTWALINALNKILGSPSRQSVVTFNRTNTDQQLVNLTESGAEFKSVICTIALPLVETSSPDHAAAAFITFCKSNNTAFEVALNTLDQVLIELMTSQPEQLAKLAEQALKFIDQLQNETSLWESLLSFPHILNPKSPDQLLTDLEKLLISLQKFLNIMEHNFPEVKNITSPIHPVFVAGIRIIDYMENWPGRSVSIRFGDVVTGNESLWQMVADIEIPLHKAIALAFDRNMAREFVCKNSSGPMWVAACATGSLDMVLGWICPNKLAQQIILSWSKFVAEHDINFMKGMIHSLGGLFEGTGTTRNARSIETQPQNIEEELFLEGGKVVLHILQLFPGVDPIVQSILRVGFQSMKTGTQAIVTVESMMENVVTDVATAHMIIQTLTTNQSQTTAWMNQALNSVVEIIVKILAHECVTCDTILDQFEWVFSIKTIKREVVQSFICGNTSTIEEALLTDWIPLIHDAEELLCVFNGQAKFNVTLPMVLSEWQKLYNQSLGFGGFLHKLEELWSEEYWMDWISENSSANHLLPSLQQSVGHFALKLGQKFEQSALWPEAKNYFHLAYWIFDCNDTSQPNCTINMNTHGIECETNFDWTRFSSLLTKLLSPTEKLLIRYLKRSVRVLQHIYSDLYKHLATSNLQNAIPGGDMFSAFLINMLHKVDEFARTLTTLPDQSFSDPQVMVPLYANLLECVGLKPLVPVILHNGPVNISQVLEVASKLGRTNQGIFTFNESDPTMAQLEKYIMDFLSLEGNLSLSVYLSMSHTMLTYSSHFSSEDGAKLKQAIKRFTNQTSSGIVEAILTSLEFLKKIMDSPSGDPSHVILGYIRQLQQFLASLFRIKRIEQMMLPNGQVTPAQVTDLHLLSEIFNILTPEVIMNLTHAGPVAAQHMIIQKYVQTLPAQVREESANFLYGFVSLQCELAKCNSDQDCLAGISELLDFLEEILGMARDAKGNVTINIASKKMYMGSKQLIPVASAFFSLTLKPNDAAYLNTVQETLQFISMLLTHPNITLSNVQEALKQANLTVEELNDLLTWIGTKDVHDLLAKVTHLQNAQKCFEQTSPASIAHCAVGLVNTISDLLMSLPALQNHASILSMIPNIVNKTVTDMIHTNFTSNPQNALAEALKATLASVKMTLQLSNMSTPEIQKEMEILASLIKLVGNPEPLKYLEAQLDEFSTSKAVLKMILWYLEKMENVTSSSSVSDLFYSVFGHDLPAKVTQLQDAQKCFEQTSPASIAHCAVGLVNTISDLLMSLPALQNHTSILSMIPNIVNKTVTDMIHTNFTSNPQNAVAEALKATLASVKMTLQLSNMSTPEIQKEMEIFASLIKLVGNPEPLKYLDVQPSEFNTGTAALEMILWYLKKLENVTSSGSVSDLFHPVFRITQMQVALLLAEMELNQFVSDEVHHLITSLQYPITEEGVVKIGNTTTAILEHVLKFIVLYLKGQNAPSAIFGYDPPINMTSVNATVMQIHNYIKLVQQWMIQANFGVWGNLNYTSVVEKDIYHLIQSTLHLFNVDQQGYLTAIGNITHALDKALMLATQPNGLQSEQFSEALLEAVQSAMNLLILINGHLPSDIQHSVLSVIKNLVGLAVHTEASYAMSLNATLDILQNLQFLINKIFPHELAQYPSSVLEVVITYFASVRSVSGPDSFNQIILNLMKTIQILLPAHSEAQFYVSTVINITKAILQPVQGKSLMSLSASEENIPYIFEQAVKVLNMLCPLFMGESCKPQNKSSMEGFADLPHVLEKLMTGQANNETWRMLQEFLAVILTYTEPHLSDEHLACFVGMFEKLIGNEVKNRKAETDLILSLQTPIMALITNLTHSLNGSHFNLSEASERLEVAVEHTVKKLEEANGTLTCQEVLKLWEPVRETVGLSPAFMGMWCNVSLQPVIDGYVKEMSEYTQHNWTCTEMGRMSAEAAAARMVMTLRSLYNTEIKQSHAIDHFIQALYTRFSALIQQPLSHEAQLNLYQQLQQWEIQNSLESVALISEELVKEFPSIRPYLDAVEKTLTHILINYQQMNDSDSIFSEAAMILLSSIDVPSHGINQILSGALANDTWVDLVLKAVQAMIDMKIFGDHPTLYHTLDQLLTSNDTKMVIDKFAGMISSFTSTEAKGLDLIVQTLTKIQELLNSVLSLLNNMDDHLPPYLQLLHNLVTNAMSFIQQLLSSGSIPMNNHYDMRQHPVSGHNSSHVRRRRDTSYMPQTPHMPVRGPVDDFIDLFYINYPALGKSLAVEPTPIEILETFHVFFANPDLEIVLKGATKDMHWGQDFSKDETIDALLGMMSLLTIPEMDYSSLDLWEHVVSLLPHGFPYASLLKNVTLALASEGKDNLRLIQGMLNTVSVLLQTNSTDPQLLEHLKHLRKQVCDLEKTDSFEILLSGLSLEPGILCDGIVPGIEILTEALLFNFSRLLDDAFEVFVGEPRLYHIYTNWTAAISQALGLNFTSLSALNFTSAASVVTIGEMVKNKTAFMLEMHKLGFDAAAVFLLTEAALPDNNLEILSWLVNLRKCESADLDKMGASEKALEEKFCSMDPEEWYRFTLFMAQHLDTKKFMYRMVMPKEVQNVVQGMLQIAATIINVMKQILPAVGQLEEYLINIQGLNLGVDNEFRQMAKSQRSTISSGATFVTISRALCSKGIFALFGVAKNPHIAMAPPTFDNNPKREEMIEQFKIPHNATPFCTNMYLDMVNTTGGAIAWAFLKPMLMGKILYTPDTPQTRAIMNKANSTLQQFADLRHYSQDWIKSSNYIVESSEMLTQTLPLLRNSLANSFVKNFIEMQTGIKVDSMQETLNNFSNMTLLLEKNKDLMGQITTLSTLMVDLSSCITFDRYQGYDTEDELNREAQDLAKDRNLYASVIFKLPKDTDSSRKRRSASSTTTLPPKVRYTIRMHMDNVMRTDRIREPFFSKETHISARQTLRYNRGFIYLQETIDRAIIDIQANKTVTDTAVQIQPFPYPCHHRDEYLEAISFVFPLLLMIAWVLFVADFVKKLVHEREMKLHEYMKMMGVSPLSHFFAWFLESAFYLVVTIFFLTLVLKYGNILPHSDGFLLFLYLCDYALSVLAFSFLISTFFDKTYIAALSGSLLYVLAFFPFIVVMAMEAHFSFSVKSLLGLFSPTAFSYASQYVSRYETQGEGIQWSNSYSSPIIGDTASFGWLCWLMLIDTFLYFIIGAYIRTVFPGKSGIPSRWYFPFTASFWKDLCGCRKSKNTGRGLFITNIMQTQPPVFPDSIGKGKGKGDLSSKTGENFSDLPVGVSLYGLTKVYGQQAAIENLNVAFYEGHVTSLLGHNGAGKTTTMSILTGLFPPSSGTVEVYGRDMQANLEDVRQELGVCMQYDVLFDHMTAKEHLLLYGQIKAPHWSKSELQEQVRTILEETGMYAHRHKRVGTLSGGMKRKLSISIAFIGGSRLVVLDEPTTGVDPCSRRSIWDIVIQHKKGRTIIMSTHHLDEAEVLSDRIAFLERGGLKCCGSPYYLKEQLGQGYKLTLTKKMHNGESKQIDNAELKAFVQAHVPEARLKEAQGSDLVYLLPPFSSNNASSYRSLLTALDSNLDALQLGCYGISDTTLEEVFLHLTHGSTDAAGEEFPTISETVSDTESISSYPESEGSNYGDTVCFTGNPTVSGVKLIWQQMTAILIKRFHHSRRDWKGLISQILLPVLFVVFAMGLGTIKSDLRHYPEMELSPALYKLGPSYSFFSNPNSSKLADSMLSFPGLDNACLENSADQICTRSSSAWTTPNSTKKFSTCKCRNEKEVCGASDYVPPHKQIPSSQIVYNVTDLNAENYLVATADNYIRNRYGGYDFGFPLPQNLKMDVKTVPKNRTLSKVWFNPEGHHTMPAYLSGMNNFILRSNLPADKDPSQYAISVSSHPYFGRPDDEDSIVQGMLQIMVALCVLAGYSITTASFAIYEVNEHHSGSKRLQHIAGVSEPFYWIVNFFYDMVIYLIPVALTVGVIALFQVPAFTDRQNLGAVTMLLILFGFATFPWMYLLSSVLKDAEMAFITYVCINLFLSVNTIIPTSILYFMRQITYKNSEALTVIFDRLSYAFLIFPQFNFGNGLLELARMNIEVQLLSGYGIDAYKNPFSTEALGWMMISSFIQGLVFFGLRLLWNKYIVRKVSRHILRRKSVHLAPSVDEDEDVAAEHLRVSTGAASSDVLQVNQLTKVYQHLNKKVPAVKKLSLGVPAGECFGLLGVNGAGKTTTFKMLTGDVSPTDGTAQIRDRNGRLVDIMECRNQGINIGYCPQVDALDDLLTGEEHLCFYARLHGISEREIPGVVNYLLRKLELNHYRDTIADGYSCGTRRKLSTALALVGHPQILLLDEPSSGMDPRTKRQLWKIISEEVKGKCAVVLTSHSMEECEALCGRLAIMVKGQFRCLGSLQHIKNRFGSGFTVKMYLVKASSDADAITRFMQSRFPSTYLKEQHSAMLEYHVPVAPGGVADIFGQLESSKEYLEIQHFSVSQTTLDEVFINFAMGKIGMETIPIEDEFEDDWSLKEAEA